jgi:hypothetical protein
VTSNATGIDPLDFPEHHLKMQNCIDNAQARVRQLMAQSTVGRRVAISTIIPTENGALSALLPLTAKQFIAV